MGGERAKLSVTAISNASEPITIYTWPNIFYPGLSQKRGSLVASDKDTHEELWSLCASIDLDSTSR
jgi:hypothetical protein